MVSCLCRIKLENEAEFEIHIDKCALIGSELWDAITDGWEQVKTHSTLQDFVIDDKLIDEDTCDNCGRAILNGTRRIVYRDGDISGLDPISLCKPCFKSELVLLMGYK